MAGAVIEGQERPRLAGRACGRMVIVEAAVYQNFPDVGIIPVPRGGMGRMAWIQAPTT